MCFFSTSAFFLFQPRVFSRALGSGARREAARTPRRKWALAEVRGTCSRGSKSQVNGEAFRARRAVQAHANPRTD